MDQQVLTNRDATHVGSNVYASDGEALTLVSTSNTAIGKIKRWISGTRCVVEFNQHPNSLCKSETQQII